MQAPEKARRMQLRRETGSRVPSPPKALSQGPEYLVAHACFDCRKSWKVQVGREAVCPQCAVRLHEMGRAFKAPKATDQKQWRKVEALWRAGFRFWHRGSTEVEPFPEHLSDVEDFILRNPDHPLRLVR